MYDARGCICVHRYLGHVFYILHIEVNMVTKYKAAVFIIAAMFSSIASAAYTTMTIEGVKQANGVWTAAGVMDTQGFVRTTGAVSVMGTTRNLPVALTVDTFAASAILKSTSRLMGPVALAASAYDVYQWYTSSGIQASGDTWTSGEFDYLNGLCTPTQGSYPGNHPVADIPSCQSYVEASTKRKTTSIVKSSKYEIWNFNDATGNLGYYSQYQKVPKSPTQSQYDNIPVPSIIILSSGFNKLPSLKGHPIPITGTSFTPFSEWYGQPYFKDGHWYRDRMDISPCPTASQPTRVCVDIGPQKFEGATDPNTVPSQATGTATGSTPKEETDFCKKNPHSIACAEFGELEDEQLDVEERPVDVSYTPWGSSTSQCPADKVIPLWDDQSITISYSPVCQFASLLRPLVIALAFVAAGFIVAGITRKGAES